MEFSIAVYNSFEKISLNQKKIYNITITILPNYTQCKKNHPRSIVKQFKGTRTTVYCSPSFQSTLIIGLLRTFLN